MKKRVSIIICICSMLALISCGEVAETSSTVSTASEVSSTASNVSEVTLQVETVAVPEIYMTSHKSNLERIINSEN